MKDSTQHGSGKPRLRRTIVSTMLLLLVAACALAPAADAATRAKSRTKKAATKAAATAKPAPAPAASAEPAKPKLPVIPDSSEPFDVKMGTVKTFYDQDAAAIVDARDADEYAAGHITGAVSLPFDAAARDESLVKKFNAGGKPIIIYCSGGDCELSKDLAKSMLDAGIRKVLVFMDGFPAWKAAGYPVETGAAKAGQ